MKIGVMIVAYNAEKTILDVLHRIPERLWPSLTEVFIFDDASQDETARVAGDYDGPFADKIRVFRNEINLGYGGNQKRGYQYAIENDFDIVVLLHGDGQYAPEALGDLVDPIQQGRAAAVFGSRMMNKGDARKGGMPLYKLLGNKILTTYQNSLLPGHLSEYHSGYRAYDVATLSRLPLDRNSDDFHFDTEIIIQLMDQQADILEVPIPTFYGDEICYVNGIGYAFEVVMATTRYRLHRMGLVNDPRFDIACDDSQPTRQQAE